MTGFFIVFPAYATTCQTGGKIFDTSAVVWSKHHKTHLYCAGNGEWRYLAQWGSVGGQHMVHVNGNVGIGTANPVTRLHVKNGSVTLDNSGGSDANTHLNILTDNRNEGEGLFTGGVNKGWAFYVRGKDFSGGSHHESQDFGLSYYNGTSWNKTMFAEHDTSNIGFGTNRPVSAVTIRRPLGEKNAITFEADHGSYVDDILAAIDFRRFYWDPDGRAAAINFHRGGAYTEGIISFATNPGTSAGQRPVERMRITEDGRVGIGTSRPNEKFTVGNAHALHTGGSIVHFYNAYYSPGAYRFAGYHDDSEDPMHAASIGLSHDDGVFSIKVSGNKGMRGEAISGWAGMSIIPGGYIGVGTDNPRSNLHILGAENTGTNAALRIQSGSQEMLLDGNEISTTVASGQDLFLQYEVPLNVRMVNGGGNVAIGAVNPASYRFSVEGTAYATGAAGALSDKRHKHNVRSLDKGLEPVLRLRPVSFEWNKPTDKGMEGRQLGFIAQEVEEILPDIVMTQDDADKTKGIKPTAIIPVLVKAVQELKAENDALKQRIDWLEGAIKPQQ